MPNRNGQPSTLQRPVQRLYPLEINYEINDNTTEEQQPPSHELDLSADVDIQPTGTTRPVRATATRAAEKLKQWTAQILEEDAVDS